MMGLNIMPTNNTTTQTLAANVLQRGGSCGTASSETLVVQQQEEGEINDILDHFLLSFEQHINNSAAREEVGAQSFAEVSEQATQTRQQQDVAEPPANALQPRMTRRTTQAMLRRKSPRKRKRTQRTSSLKSDEASVGDPPSPGVKTTRVFPDLQDKQLQQIAVVKLERRGLLPLQVNLQDSGSLNTKVTHTAIWMTKTQMEWKRQSERENVHIMFFSVSPAESDHFFPSETRHEWLIQKKTECLFSNKIIPNQEQDEGDSLGELLLFHFCV